MIKQVKSLNQEIVFRMAKTLILFHLVKFLAYLMLKMQTSNIHIVSFWWIIIWIWINWF